MGRKGFSSKIHLLCDGQGLPMDIVLTAGQKQECKVAKELLGHCLRRWGFRSAKKKPRYVSADKGYDHQRFRRWLKTKKIKDAIANINGKTYAARPLHFPKRIYKRRIVIEHCFGRMKEKRGLARRSEKLAVNYQSQVWLEIILLYLKRLTA